MKQKYRLKSHRAFQSVYAQGRSVANRAAVLYVQSQPKGTLTKIGFAAGRKLGHAVVRNRVKRRLREAVRLQWERVKPGYYLVLIARRGAVDMPFDQLQALVAELFQRAGVVFKEGKEP